MITFEKYSKINDYNCYQFMKKIDDVTTSASS